MVRVIRREPPKQGDSLVVWPHPTLPTHKISSIEAYWRLKGHPSRSHIIVRRDLGIAIAIARARARDMGVSTVYVAKG
jgi:hypothetical protein